MALIETKNVNSNILQAYNNLVNGVLVSLNSNGTLKDISITDGIASGYLRLNTLQLCWGRVTVVFSNESSKIAQIINPVLFKDFSWQLICTAYHPAMLGNLAVDEWQAKSLQIAAVRIFDVKSVNRTGTAYIQWFAIGRWT